LIVRTKLFFDLHLVEFLGTSPFFANKAQIYSRITPLVRRWHVQTYLSATLSRCARLTGSRDVSILHAPSDPIVSNSLRNREINYHSTVQHILYSYVYPVRVRMFMLFDLYILLFDYIWRCDIIWRLKAQIVINKIYIYTKLRLFSFIFKKS